jgi:hypothetical protein
MQRANRECGGFLKEIDVAVIATDPTTRLCMLLVRCGGGRFLAPAQDVAHFIEAIEKSGMDYVRDVSVPATARDSAPRSGEDGYTFAVANER